MQMNAQDYKEFRIKIKTLNDDHLLALERWLDSRQNEKDKAEKIEIINLEIERRFKVRRYYESFS